MDTKFKVNLGELDPFADKSLRDYQVEAKKNIEKITLKKYHTCFAYYKDIFPKTSILQLDGLLKQPVLLPSKNSSLRMKLDELLEKYKN